MQIFPYYNKATKFSFFQFSRTSTMNGSNYTSDSPCMFCFQLHKHTSLHCWGWYPGPEGCAESCCKLGFGETGPEIPSCLAIGGNDGWAQRPLRLFAGGGTCDPGGKATCCWAGGGDSCGPWKDAGCPEDARRLGVVPEPEQETMSAESEPKTYYQHYVEGVLVFLSTITTSKQYCNPRWRCCIMGILNPCSHNKSDLVV